MTMTKKEREQIAYLKLQLHRLRAFRLTENVPLDVPVPPHSGSVAEKLSKGFMYVGERGYTGGRIEPACSSSIYHAIGRTDKTTSQGAMALYSTKLLALKAMRYAVEQDCINRLAAVDTQIAAEQCVEHDSGRAQ